MEMTKARAWRELNQAALRHNVKILQEALAPGCRLMAVVKADAYGHGAIPVARYLQAQGVEAFAVACLSEAAALREAGIEKDSHPGIYAAPAGARAFPVSPDPNRGG